ncbi:TetR/AcrR family transcriptional regulator [Cryptosporangium sp. NPDC051539]|uniref:TetR/AcrR family transcriptional regulator n=1 Tax=Cryptosporangium sp. NPDC051539 TaxID=3363962 RepID=UPI0037A42617
MTSTTPAAKRTQAQRRDAARTAIVETAIRLLADGGYANMTLADLGERAGYSRSLAAHYFGSKPKLLAAVVDHVLRDNPLARLDESLSGLARVEAELSAVFEGLEKDPNPVRAYLVITFEAITTVPELRPVVHQQNVAFRGRIQSALRDGAMVGTVRRELDAGSVGIAITAMVRGIVWEWFTDSSLDLAVCRRALLGHVVALCAPD